MASLIEIEIKKFETVYKILMQAEPCCRQGMELDFCGADHGDPHSNLITVLKMSKRERQLVCHPSTHVGALRHAP